MKEILEYIAKSLVDNPDAVVVTEETKEEEADLLKGITKKGTVYITFDEAKAEAVYEANPGILVEAANLLRYTAYIFFVPA